MPVLPRLSALVPFVCALAAAAPAHAEQEAQLWINGIATIPLDDQSKILVDTSLRMNETAEGISAYLLRATALTHVADKVEIGGGYAQIWNYDDGDFTVSESRLHQDAWVHFPINKGGTLTSRTRLEERFFSNGSSDVGVRLRQMAQYIGSELGETKLKPVLSEEVFYRINDNDRQNSGFDQARTIVGLRYPMTDRLNVDVNYYNQWVFRPGDDLVRHSAMVLFGYKF